MNASPPSTSLPRSAAALILGVLGLMVATVGLFIGDLVTMDSRWLGNTMAVGSAIAGAALMAWGRRLVGKRPLSPWLLLVLVPYVTLLIWASLTT